MDVFVLIATFLLIVLATVIYTLKQFAKNNKAMNEWAQDSETEHQMHGLDK